jgi:hypothetical protein
MFRSRGLALGPGNSPGADNGLSNWIAPGERGFDRIELQAGETGSLLAFIHLSEAAAAHDFAEYRSVLIRDPPTRTMFDHILRDEEHHMQYSLAQLQRVAPADSQAMLLKARLRRLWKAYLRLATALAGVIAGVLLTIQYFILLPPFALIAKLAARRERPGWMPISGGSDRFAGREF